ncbi:hypothetical protein GCM10027396_37160 [Insolitispirillum peregrinum]
MADTQQAQGNGHPDPGNLINYNKSRVLGIGFPDIEGAAPPSDAKNGEGGIEQYIPGISITGQCYDSPRKW